MMFGKQAARFDSRTFKMDKYVSATYTPPAFADNLLGIKNWGMMLNATLGCCTVSAVGHALQVWTRGKTTVPDSTILSYYEKWCGYVQGDPATDRGGVELDVLNSFRHDKFAGHVLRGYRT